jgi:hypothetical protein
MILALLAFNKSQTFAAYCSSPLREKSNKQQAVKRIIFTACLPALGRVSYLAVVVVVTVLGATLSLSAGGTVAVCCSIVPFLFHVVVVEDSGGCCAVCCEAVGTGTTVVVLVSFTWRPPHPTNINADRLRVANAREAFLSIIINNPLQHPKLWRLRAKPKPNTHWRKHYADRATVNDLLSRQRIATN